ncbi:MAG: sulfatase [Planctomycetaceae bacterium]|nr:sulfatase [Planctomycetaceae bacterium]
MNQLPIFSRREALKAAACGFGGVALQGLTGSTARAATKTLAVHVPHHAAKAKRVIFLFMAGGPSQADLFDPKPFITKHHGQTIAAPVDDHQLRVGVEKFLAMGPVAPVRPRGESGMMISDLMPNIASVADDLCLLRGMYTDNKAHAPATLQLHTGTLAESLPSMGSWISYGLGTENDNLPSFITIHPPEDVRNYGSSFLRARHQGTPLNVPASEKASAIKYLQDPDTSAIDQRRRLDFVQHMNRKLLDRVETDAQMEGIIESFELAFRMQAETPRLVDLSGESQETLRLYGIDGKQADRNGRACLLARRMSEAGVRFVQVTMGGWDHHGNIRGALRGSCAGVDKPIGGLIKDLKRRGLLDETLVLWSGEFGRSPWSQDLSGTSPISTHGREHQQESFCTWMAGGGVKPGLTYGNTDDFGYRPIDGKVHLHDLHATMLHLLGLDHERLTPRHAGRDFRLTDIYGDVVREILA